LTAAIPVAEVLEGEGEGNLLDALGYGPVVFGLKGNGLEDQEIASALDKIGWFCNVPRLPTLVDDHIVIPQEGILAAGKISCLFAYSVVGYNYKVVERRAPAKTQQDRTSNT
jgi:hypothetical protein